MIDDLIFYITLYVSLFGAVFWLIVFFSRQEPKKTKLLRPLSIVIPAYNNAHYLERCVQSIRSQRYPDLTVIIVDDGSTDHTTVIGKKLTKTYRNVLYKKKKNGGKASALNFGLRFVKTPFFGFIDSDTFLSPNALTHMMQLFNDKTAAVTASVRPSESHGLVQAIQKIEYMISSFNRFLMSALGALYYTPAFALYKTDVIRRLGGFDEETLTEDLEIGLHLQSKGYRIANSLEISAYTITPTTFSKLFSQRMRWYRGYIQNSRTYSHMFFNKQYGDLGLFVLPIHYIILCLTSLLMGKAGFDLLLSGFRLGSDLLLTHFDLSFLISRLHITILSPTTIFLVLMTAIFIVMMALSQKHIREQVWKTEYAIFFILYPFINLFLWLSAFVLEYLGVEKTWT